MQINWKNLSSLIIVLLVLISFGCREKLKSNQFKTKSGLIYEIVRLGHGATVKRGDMVRMHQVCTYKSGTVIFSTHNLGYPVNVNIGDGTAVKGVDEGVTGMLEGEIRKLIVPPSLSKRKKYPSHLSPDSTLYYTIEVLEIRN